MPRQVHIHLLLYSLLRPLLPRHIMAHELIANLGETFPILALGEDPAHTGVLLFLSKLLLDTVFIERLSLLPELVFCQFAPPILVKTVSIKQYEMKQLRHCFLINELLTVDQIEGKYVVSQQHNFLLVSQLLQSFRLRCLF